MPFFTSSDVHLLFQREDGSPCLHALLPACNGFLRSTSGATPADLLMARIAEDSKNTWDESFFLECYFYVNEAISLLKLMEYFVF